MNSISISTKSKGAFFPEMCVTEERYTDVKVHQVDLVDNGAGNYEWYVKDKLSNYSMAIRNQKHEYKQQNSFLRYNGL
jgi:hypothetical protein